MIVRTAEGDRLDLRGVESGGVAKVDVGADKIAVRLESADPGRDV